MIANIFESKIVNVNFLSPYFNLILDSEDNDFKQSLNQYTSIINPGNKPTLSIPKDVLYNGIQNEIFGFYFRVIKQRKSLEGFTGDYSWYFVTQYYLSFFLISILNRYNGYFCSFFNKATAGELTEKLSTFPIDKTDMQFTTVCQGLKIIKINTSEFNDTYNVKLEPSSDTHKTTWKCFYSFLLDYEKELLKFDPEKKNQESQIVAVLIKTFKPKNNILSEYRNIINYKHEIGYDRDFEYPILNRQNFSADDLYKEILKLNALNSIESVVKALPILNEYLYYLVDKLIDSHNSIDYHK